MGDIMKKAAFLLALTVTGCAGRDAAQIASVQPQDAYSNCTMIRAEIEANNVRANQLANEQGLKVAQNVAAGVVGLVIWPIWFGMDFKGAAGQDIANLQARQQFLTTLATERCKAEAAPAVALKTAKKQPKRQAAAKPEKATEEAPSE